MKFLLTIIAAIIFTTTINAQAVGNVQGKTVSTVAKSKTTKSTTTTTKIGDHWKMADNGMMLAVKGGITTTMSTDAHLKNGTVILTDGTVVTKAGKKSKLQRAQRIDAKGKITGGAVTSSK